MRNAYYGVRMHIFLFLTSTNHGVFVSLNFDDVTYKDNDK